jgi:hypothetical protein
LERSHLTKPPSKAGFQVLGQRSHGCS